MKITLIAETLDPTKGGIPRYNYEISKIKAINNVINFSENAENVSLTAKALNRLYRRRKYFETNSKNIEDVLHFTQPEIMFRSSIFDGKITILTVHDLAVFGTMKVTNLYGKLRSAAFRRQFLFAVNRADFILVNSSQTRDELVKILEIDKNKITVSNFGIEKRLKPIKTEQTNVIGYFGGFNKRKRVDKLIDDYLNSDIRGKIELWLYGNETEEYPKLFKKYGKKKGVKFIGRVPEDKLIEVLNSIRFFVFPTSYEGQGLPILEGIACGTPTFIYEDAVIPAEVKKYLIKISKLDDISRYDYKKLRKEFLKKSKLVKKEFDWGRTRADTLKVYKKASALKQGNY